MQCTWREHQVHPHVNVGGASSFHSPRGNSYGSLPFVSFSFSWFLSFERESASVADTKARFIALVAGVSREEAKRRQFYAGVDL